MKQVLGRFLTAILLGAAIGAVAGLAISRFEPRALLDGAMIGAAIGAFFGLRAQIIRRSAADAGLAPRADRSDS